MVMKIYGPYLEGDVYRVTWTPAGEGKRSVKFKTELEAVEHIKGLRAAAAEWSVRDMIEAFLIHLEERGTASSTRATNKYRLNGMLGPVLNSRPEDLTDVKAEVLYRSYRETHAPDTHRGALSIAKAMFEWARKKKRIRVSPWLDIDPLDKKRTRKNQLRLDEARKLSAWCEERAMEDDGALAVLVALVLGFRAFEVVGLVGRDLDDGGTKLWVDRSKTAAGERMVVLPEVLRQPLMKRAEQRSGKLLPYKAAWVRANTKRACRAAGVTVVCAQALRGTNATFALEAGVAPEAVAKSLGHTNSKITRRSYALPGAGRGNEAVDSASKLNASRQRPMYDWTYSKGKRIKVRGPGRKAKEAAWSPPDPDQIN